MQRVYFLVRRRASPKIASCIEILLNQRGKGGDENKLIIKIIHVKIFVCSQMCKITIIL